jgi:RimJ/RimL family protein N-acetyltransferase
MSMDIRIAKDDKDSISASEIYAMSWKAGYKGIFSDKLLEDIPLDFWVNTFNSNYETQRFEIALISVGGKDIGAGGYGLSRDYNDRETGEITSIYFLQKTWGKGYSKILIDFMIDNLRKRGCKKIHIWVLENNIRAQMFYEKCGFKRTGNKKEVAFCGESVTDIEYAL